MENLIKIENSSNLEAYYYEPATKVLFIEFKSGALYGYDLVEPEIIVAFLAAESKGAYLSRHIKPKYKCTQFRAPSADLLKMEINKNNA
jgi:KTSC domain